MYTIYSDGELVYSPNISDVLSDSFSATNPQLSLEVGHAGSLTFTLPPGNDMYDKITKMLSVITVKRDDDELFRGRVLDYETDFYKNRTYYCEGDLAFLNDGVRRPYNIENCSIEKYFKTVLEEYNSQVDEYKQFQPGTVTISGTSTSGFTFSNEEYSDILSDLEAQLSERFGGYLKTRLGADNKRYLDILLEPGVISSQAIEFGVNIIDLNSHISADDILTVLVPVGADGLTIKTVNDGKDYLVHENAAKMFGRIWGFYKFDDISDVNALRSIGITTLDALVKEAVEININAVDLSMVEVDYEKIICGNMYRVVSAPHGIDRYFMCKKVELNLSDPAQSNYTFSNPPSSVKGLSTTSNGITMAVSGVGALKESSKDTKAIAIQAAESAQAAQDAIDSRLYESMVSSSNGIIFKDFSSSTTLTATIYDGSDVITDIFLDDGGSIIWFDENGTQLGTGKTLTVNSSSFSTLDPPTKKISFYAYDAGNHVKAFSEITLSVTLDGASGTSSSVSVYIITSDNVLGTAMLGVTVYDEGAIVADSRITGYSWTKNEDSTIISTNSVISVDDLNAVYNCAVTWE